MGRLDPLGERQPRAAHAHRGLPGEQVVRLFRAGGRDNQNSVHDALPAGQEWKPAAEREKFGPKRRHQLSADFPHPAAGTRGAADRRVPLGA